MKNEENAKVFGQIYPNGKIQVEEGTVAQTYVTAVCKLYETRCADANDYMVMETGMAERVNGQSIAACFALVKDMAYSGAVSRVTGVTVPAAMEPMISGGNLGDELPSGTDSTEDTVAVTPEPEDDLDQNPDTGSTVQKMDLNLFSGGQDETSTQKGNKDALVITEEEDEEQKARSIPITALGKMHMYYNWTAGRILDENPGVIVDFAPKYSGPKEEEKKALMALLPEAVRRCAQKAA